MATEILRPGAVEVSPNSLDPGAIAGSPPQWDDDSDSTYATTFLSVSTTSAVQARAVAPLSAMTAPAADVTAITLQVRCKTSNTGGAVMRRVGFSLWSATHGEFAGFGYVTDSDFYEAPADEEIHDLVIPLAGPDLSAFGTSLSVVAARLATGGVEFRAFRYSGFGAPSTVARYEMTVYEMWLEVTYAGVEPPTGRPIRPPLRYHPRDDGLGMSSVRRVDANRSTQASLRRAGGTYF